MRNLLEKKFPASAVYLLGGWLLLSSCAGESSSEDQLQFEEFEQSEFIVRDFAYQVIVPTYELLAERLDALDGAVKALEGNPTEANLEAAKNAWIAARLPWEQSEGFLFGPVDARGIDPALDSWPVNQTDLDAVLQSGDTLSTEYMANLDPTLKGFHTAEYLLFGAANDQTTPPDSRSLEYLEAVTAEMVVLAEELALAWTMGLDGAEPYAELLATAGTSDNYIYPSLSAVGEELLRGAIGILDEVANGKLADPFTQQDPNLVESQFSYNSLQDFADNIRSVQNAYQGGVPEVATAGVGLAIFVAEVDIDFNDRVLTELQLAIDAIGLIPDPFRDAILDPEAADEIVAAQEAIRLAKDTLEQEVFPLVIH